MIKTTTKILITTLTLTLLISPRLANTASNEKQYVGPRGYLKTEWFEVDTQSTDSFIFIKLKHLSDMFAKSRKSYIKDLVDKNRANLIRIEPLDDQTVLKKMFTYTPHENLHMYSRGIIPVKIENVFSYEGLDLRIGIKTDFQVRRVLEPTATSQSHYNNVAITNSDMNRILTDENSHVVFWSSNWVQQFDFSGLFTFLGYLMRGFVIVMQFFLTFIRPCTAKKDTLYYHWSISFTSSMFHLQFLLLYGLIAENFGGPLNTAMENMLRTSRSRFFGYLESDYAKFFDDDFEDVGFWKLVEAKYVGSPIFENYVGMILLILSIIFCHCLSGAQGGGSNSVAKKFRIGCSMAFMVPLLVSSVNCIYAVFTGVIITFGALFSVAGSLFCLIYYLLFGFEIMGSHPKSKYYKSSYTHINFDFFPGFTPKPIRNFEFFCMYIMIIIVVFGVNFPIIPIGAVVVFYILMLIMDLATPRSERIRDKFLELKRVHSLKVSLFGLRALFFSMLFVFIIYRKKVSSLGIKTLTTLAYIGLIIDMILNWAIFAFRAAGMVNDGVKKRVEGFKGDPNGPYVEMTNDQKLAVDAAKTYAKYGGML